MHHVKMPGLQLRGAPAAAVHIEDIELQSLLGIEARRLRGPPCQHGVGRIGYPRPKRDRFGGACGGLPADQSQSDRKQALPARTPSKPDYTHRAPPDRCPRISSRKHSSEIAEQASKSLDPVVHAAA